MYYENIIEVESLIEKHEPSIYIYIYMALTFNLRVY